MPAIHAGTTVFSELGAICVASFEDTEPEAPGLAIFIPVDKREIMNHLVAIGLMKKRPLRGWRRGLKAREKLALTSV